MLLLLLLSSSSSLLSLSLIYHYNYYHYHYYYYCYYVCQYYHFNFEDLMSKYIHIPEQFSCSAMGKIVTCSGCLLLEFCCDCISENWKSSWAVTISNKVSSEPMICVNHMNSWFCGIRSNDVKQLWARSLSWYGVTLGYNELTIMNKDLHNWMDIYRQLRY